MKSLTFSPQASENVLRDASNHRLSGAGHYESLANILFECLLNVKMSKVICPKGPVWYLSVVRRPHFNHNHCETPGNILKEGDKLESEITELLMQNPINWGYMHCWLCFSAMNSPNCFVSWLMRFVSGAQMDMREWMLLGWPTERLDRQEGRAGRWGVLLYSSQSKHRFSLVGKHTHLCELPNLEVIVCLAWNI